MLAHMHSLGRNPRGSLDFLAYPVPKACKLRVLGTWVPRCLGVARFASSCKEALGLECSLTAGLRTWFGRVICMARAASVSGLWTLSSLLLCGACAWVWGSSSPGFSWLPIWVWGSTCPLAGACGLCGLVFDAPVSRLFFFGFGVRVFVCGLQGFWWV